MELRREDYIIACLDLNRADPAPLEDADDDHYCHCRQVKSSLLCSFLHTYIMYMYGEVTTFEIHLPLPAVH